MTTPVAADGPAPGQHRAAILGFPARHSLSPVIHRRAYELLGLSGWTYDIHEVQPDELPEFLSGLDDSWRGFSATMPLKETVATLGEPNEVVRLCGVANTLVIDHFGAGRRYRVHNTDIGGFRRAIITGSVPRPQTATVVGSGATARSAVVALSELATSVTIAARSPGKADALAEFATGLGMSATTTPWGRFPAADLVVSTIPAAGLAEFATEVVAGRPGQVFDVIYHPWPTPLAAAAMAAGIAVLDGLDLLVHQATEQIELFTGHKVAAEPLLSAVRKAAASRFEA